jgi:MraZ protein
VFRGNIPARIDDKGRLKVPNTFRALLEGKYGRELFLTSVSGEFVRIYPMPVWLEIEQKLGSMPSTHPSRLRFLDRVNYFGQAVEIDVQGRVLMPVRLRDAATMNGDVVLGRSTASISGTTNAAHEDAASRSTDEDARALSEFRI